MKDRANLEAAMKLAGPVLAASHHGDEAVIAAATSIVRFVEQRAAINAPLLIGTDTALPAMHKALGSALVARRDMLEARLASFAVGRELKIIDTGEQCPCGGGIEAEGAVMSLVPKAA